MHTLLQFNNQSPRTPHGAHLLMPRSIARLDWPFDWRPASTGESCAWNLELGTWNLELGDLGLGDLGVWGFGGLGVWGFGGLVVWWFGGLVVWRRLMPVWLPTSTPMQCRDQADQLHGLPRCGSPVPCAMGACQGRRFMHEPDDHLVHALQRKQPQQVPVPVPVLWCFGALVL